MRLTPLDIRKQPFMKKLMGFDPDQVNSFLEQVASEYEQIVRQNDELSAQVREQTSQLDQYRKIEKILNDTLITAQRATDEGRINAQKEAELILRDAQLRAEKYEEKSRQTVSQLESDIISLRTQRDSFLTRLRSMLKDQLALVDIMGGTLKDPNPKDPMVVASTAAAHQQVAQGRLLSQLGRPVPPVSAAAAGHAHPERMSAPVSHAASATAVPPPVQRLADIAADSDETMDEVPPQPVV